MASYNLILDTKFKPFSYQEMLAPVAASTKAHQEIESAYGELDAQANAVGSLASEATDPITYARYKNYENSLRQEADLLAQQGLSPTSKRSLNRLKADYSEKIIPIQNAITRRRQLADEQRQAILKDPTLMFQRDFSVRNWDTSLDRFINNPDYDYGASMSGALLTKQASDMASKLAGELTAYGRGKSLDAYTNTFLKKYGLSKEEVLDAIYNPNSESKALQAIRDEVMAASGLAGWDNTEIWNKGLQYANMGLWSAIGKGDVTTYENKAAILAAQEANQETNQETILNGPAANPRNIYSNRHEYNKNIADYAKYFKRNADGTYSLNEEGKKEVNRKIGKNLDLKSVSAMSQKDSVIVDEWSPFRKFYDSIHGNFAEYLKNNPNAQYDATKTTEFYYAADQGGTEQAQIKAAISRVMGSMPSLSGMKFDDKSSEYVKDYSYDKALTKEVLQDKDTKVLGTAFSNYGKIVELEDKDGNFYTVELPAGINVTNERNRDRELAKMESYSALINSGQFVSPEGLIRSATPEEIADAQRRYAEALQKAYLHHSQLWYSNKTNSQEFNPYSY